jgi:hypothetical protein
MMLFSVPEVAFSRAPERWVRCVPLLASAILAAGCGHSPTIDTHGHFATVSLKGNYTYAMGGALVGGSVYQEAGTFVADGNGHIVSGNDDFVQGTIVSQTFVGSYDIAPTARAPSLSQSAPRRCSGL